MAVKNTNDKANCGMPKCMSGKQVCTMKGNMKGK